MPRKKLKRVSQRYDVSGLTEAQFEPGSKKTVLRNLLKITNRKDIDRIEALALQQVADLLINNLNKNRRFTALDVKTIHKLWLGNIYSWAGDYRQVNLSKENFAFAAASQISHLMKEFEEGPLRRHTPCNFSSLDRTIQALAEVHTELVLIHPFREGNGRVARLFTLLMAEQSGILKLDFALIKGSVKNEYFSAVRAGLDRDYKPMERIFTRLAISKEV